MIQILKKAKWIAAIFMVLSVGGEARDYYGAIALSPSTGYYGYSYDYRSRRDAERYSLRQCGYRDCEVLVWFRNGCGALAIGTRGYGSGWGNTRARAEYEALKSCRQYTRGCRIKRWICTTR